MIDIQHANVVLTKNTGSLIDRLPTSKVTLFQNMDGFKTVVLTNPNKPVHIHRSKMSKAKKTQADKQTNKQANKQKTIKQHKAKQNSKQTMTFTHTRRFFKQFSFHFVRGLGLRSLSKLGPALIGCFICFAALFFCWKQQEDLASS